MEQNATDIILKEIAVIQSKLDDTKSDLKDIKQENKENFERILKLKDKQAELEKEIQLLKQKVESLEKHHDKDIANQNKKWDLPRTLLVSVITAISAAILNLILK